MNSRLIIIILSAQLTWFFSCPSRAENWPISILYNQLKNGTLYCPKVTAKDVERFQDREECSANTESADGFGKAYPIYEKLIFARAAELQNMKDTCLNEQIASLTMEKNKAKFDQWIIKLSRTWMASQKSAHILSNCNSMFESRLDPAEVKRRGKDGAYELVRKRMVMHGTLPAKPSEDEKKWKKICFDESEMKKLRSAALMLQVSIPFISSPEFIKIMAKHRHVVLNNATDKAITDDEIAARDLMKKGGLTINTKLSPAFREDLKAALKAAAKDRAEQSSDMVDKGGRGKFDLSSGQKDYLFQEGTAHQVLEEFGEIPKITTADQMATTKVGNAPACLFSRYQETVAGELIEFGVTSVVAVGLLYKLARAGLIAAEAFGMQLGTIRGASQAGLTAAGLTAIGKDLYKNCVSQSNRAEKSAVASQVMASVGENIESDADFLEFTRQIQLPTEEIPACAKNELQGLVRNTHFVTNCLEASITSVAPFKIAVPAALVLNAH